MLFAENWRTPVREQFATVRELICEQISETQTPVVFGIVLWFNLEAEAGDLAVVDSLSTYS